MSHCWSIRGHQRPSEAITSRLLARQSEAIRGNQRPSEAITSRLLARQRVRICSPNELPIDVCRFVNSRLSRAIGLSSTDTAPLAVRGCSATIAVCTQRASGEDQIAPTCGERIGGRRDEHLHAGLHTAGEWRRPDRAHLWGEDRGGAVMSTCMLVCTQRASGEDQIAPTCGHQRSSAVIRGHQDESEVISGEDQIAHT
jgi:hypothetical protein